MTTKAWRLDRLGGDLRFENLPMPEVRLATNLNPRTAPVKICAIFSAESAFIQDQTLLRVAEPESKANFRVQITKDLAGRSRRNDCHICSLRERPSPSWFGPPGW
jgi:hypothetical protein